MQIPKSFKLGDKTFTVEWVRHTDTRGTMGNINYNTRRVQIATNSNLSDRSFKQEEIDDTFWHEVTHAILRDMGHRLWNNEPFVTEFSKRLTQVVNTAKL